MPATQLYCGKEQNTVAEVYSVIHHIRSISPRFQREREVTASLYSRQMLAVPLSVLKNAGENFRALSAFSFTSTKCYFGGFSRRRGRWLRSRQVSDGKTPLKTKLNEKDPALRHCVDTPFSFLRPTRGRENHHGGKAEEPPLVVRQEKR